MCTEIAEEIHRCQPYRVAYGLADRYIWNGAWATDRNAFRETEAIRARELCEGTDPFVVNIGDAAEELFYRLHPLSRGHREAAAWFWLREVCATPAELKSDPHFYRGFIDGCVDDLSSYYYSDTPSQPPITWDGPEPDPSGVFR